MDRIDRIRKMEHRFDEVSAAVSALEKAIKGFESVAPEQKRLSDYQNSGEWQKDYEEDEKGTLPANLKRGVLSQDALYDLLLRADALLARLGIEANKAEDAKP